MAKRAGSALAAIALVAGLAVTALPAAAGGASGPEPGRLYRSTEASDASVRLLQVGDRPDGRAQVVVAATFECEELELEGVLLAPVKADGSFRVESGGFTLTGGGTDEVDAEVVVDGRFRGTRVEGSIAAEAEAFDNAGTTGTCDDEVDWDARAGAPSPALERIEGTVSLTAGPAVVAATPDLAYVVTTPDEAEDARLQRVDAATNQVEWEVAIRTEIAALAATTAAVWAVDGEGTSLFRLDAATGDPVATVPLPGPGGDEQLSFTPAVAADETAVWIAAGDLFRIDPATNAVVATIDLGDDAADAALALGAGGVYVAVESSSPDGGGHLLRVDPATNAVVAEVEDEGDFVALAAGDALWGAPFFDDVRRFDPTTLADAGTVDVEARALAAAPPGAWMPTDRGIAAYAADSDRAAVHIPILGGDFGSIAAAGDAVWVWDARLGTLFQIEAG